MNYLSYFAEQDGAEPSGNSVACCNLIRLASFLNRSDLTDKATKFLSSMKEILTELPYSCPELLIALVNLVDSTTQVLLNSILKSKILLIIRF